LCTAGVRVSCEARFCLFFFDNLETLLRIEVLGAAFSVRAPPRVKKLRFAHTFFLQLFFSHGEINVPVNFFCTMRLGSPVDVTHEYLSVHYSGEVVSTLLIRNVSVRHKAYYISWLYFFA